MTQRSVAMFPPGTVDVSVDREVRELQKMEHVKITQKSGFVNRIRQKPLVVTDENLS